MRKTISSKIFYRGHALRMAVGIAMLILLLASGAGAAPYEQWNKTFGGIGYDLAYIFQQTSDSGYILAGWTRSFGDGSNDAWLIKTDSNGNQLWNKTFGRTGSDAARAVQQTSDGGYILAGWTNSFGDGSNDAWLIKTDSNGNQLWNKTFGGTDLDEASYVHQISDGSYVLAGWTNLSGNGSAWLIKTDSNGNQLWNKTFGGTGNNIAWSAQQTSDDGYILAGWTNSFGDGSKDAWLIKTDANGNQLWNKTIGGTDEDGANAVQQTSDGGYILAGWTRSFENRGDYDAWLIKTDSNGNKQWNKTFGGIGWDTSNAVQQTLDGGYILTGSTNSSENGDYNGWLIKTDSNGNELWNMTFGRADSDDHSRFVQQTADSGYILAGWTSSFGNGDYDAWLIKVSGEAAYNIMDLGTLGGNESFAVGINESGQVVGYSNNASGHIRGFLWENGVMTDLGTLGGTQSYARDINDYGQIVGFSNFSALSDRHAFLWKNGAMTDIGTLGGTESFAFGINNQEQVAGWSYNASGYRHAFLLENGVMTDLGTLGGTQSSAWDINNQGQVVGESYNASGYRHAFLWENDAMTDLGTLPGGTESTAYGINDRGQVVGYSNASSGYYHAFLWENGVMTDLGTLGETESMARGINNLGQVVGFSNVSASGYRHAFLWENGVMTDLGTLGETESIAANINNQGRVVGYSYNTSGYRHATLWTARTAIVVYTDKTNYIAGDTMKIGLNITNPGSATTVAMDIWIDLPNGGKKAVLSYPSITLPAGLDWKKYPWKSIILPSIPSGNYAWHAVLKNTTSGNIISESISPWTFSTAATTGAESIKELENAFQGVSEEVYFVK